MAEEREQRQTTRMLGELKKLPTPASRSALPQVRISEVAKTHGVQPCAHCLKSSEVAKAMAGACGGALKNALPPLHPHMSRKIRIAGYRLKGGKLCVTRAAVGLDRLRLAAASGREPRPGSRKRTELAPDELERRRALMKKDGTGQDWQMRPGPYLCTPPREGGDLDADPVLCTVVPYVTAACPEIMGQHAHTRTAAGIEIRGEMP